MTTPRPFAELRDSGLLWLINAAVFHPRGYALALHIDETSGAATGWSLLGDGGEVWQYDGGTDALFAAAEATLSAARGAS